MLVLSRRQNDCVVFPQLGITIQVSRIAGRIVQLGIDAPREIQVLREELVDSVGGSGQPRKPQSHSKVLGHSKAALGKRSEPTNEATDQLLHSLRNRINKAMLSLQLLQVKVQNSHRSVDDTFQEVFDSLQQLNFEVERRVPFPSFNPETGSKAKQDELQGGLSFDESEQSRLIRALIVDDSENEARLLSQYLEMSGCETSVVGNGLEAIQWLQQNSQPDVILMDMNMPKLDGPSTIERIKRDHCSRNIPIFGVSGLDQASVPVKTGCDGVDGWFTKPVNAKNLLWALNQISC